MMLPAIAPVAGPARPARYATTGSAAGPRSPRYLGLSIKAVVAAEAHRMAATTRRWRAPVVGTPATAY